MHSEKPQVLPLAKEELWFSVFLVLESCKKALKVVTRDEGEVVERKGNGKEHILFAPEFGPCDKAGMDNKRTNCCKHCGDDGERVEENEVVENKKSYNELENHVGEIMEKELGIPHIEFSVTQKGIHRALSPPYALLLELFHCF